MQTLCGGTAESRGVKEVLVLVSSLREIACFSPCMHALERF